VLGIGVEIRRLRRQHHPRHPRVIDQALKGGAEFPIAVMDKAKRRLPDVMPEPFVRTSLT